MNATTPHCCLLKDVRDSLPKDELVHHGLIEKPQLAKPKTAQIGQFIKTSVFDTKIY